MKIILFPFLFVAVLHYEPLVGQVEVSGIISDENNSPIIGANIIEWHKTNGTLTNERGEFHFVVSDNATLVISYTGYVEQKINLAGQKNFSIRMSPDVYHLDEVVVTGYSTEKVRSIAGSVSVLKNAEINEVPASQPEQMLQGKVAGLNIITSGMPGAASNISIHGIGNFGDVRPLYIIDGVQGDINLLNPADIESIQVLKDAASYSIYGVRGANGVILVTTKKGTWGKPKISYEASINYTIPNKGFDLLNPLEMMRLSDIANKVSGTENPFYPKDANGTSHFPDYYTSGIDIPFKGYLKNEIDLNRYNISIIKKSKDQIADIFQIMQPNQIGTDWYHALFKPAITHQHTLSLSGANEQINYLFSFNYLDQQGSVINTYLKKYVGRANTFMRINNRIKIGENIQYTSRSNPQIPYGIADNVIFRALTNQPAIPIYDIRGNWGHLLPQNSFADNPVASQEISKSDINTTTSLSGSAYVEANVLPNLVFKSTLGGNFDNLYNTHFAFSSYLPTLNSLPDNRWTEQSGYRNSLTWSNTLNYIWTKSDHRLQFLLGNEVIHNDNRIAVASKSNFEITNSNYLSLGNGNALSATSQTFANESKYLSYFAKLDYGWKDKYFLTGTLRRDGSSLFSRDHRIGWFPAVGLAWRVSEEDWLKNSAWLNEWKVRASYGVSGFAGNTNPLNQFDLFNSNINSSYYDIFGISTNPEKGYQYKQIGGYNTTWQKDKVFNVGFESILFNQSTRLTVDFYHKISGDLLFKAALPAILGTADRPNVNIGKLQNKGVDIQLSHTARINQQLSLSSGITFTMYRNKILQIDGTPFFQSNDLEHRAFFVRHFVDHPMGTFFGYRVEGLFNSNEELSRIDQEAKALGRFKFKDLDGNGIINEADRTIIGDPNPRFTAGINLGLKWKQFELSTYSFLNYGNDVNNFINQVLHFNSTGPYNGGANLAAAKDILTTTWAPDRPYAQWPKIENDLNFSNGLAGSSAAIQKGTYFRNRSFMVSYLFPRTFLEKLKIDGVRMHLQAINLFTITSYKGLDPELSGYTDGLGVDLGNYPNQRQFLFSINLNF